MIGQCPHQTNLVQIVHAPLKTHMPVFGHPLKPRLSYWRFTNFKTAVFRRGPIRTKFGGDIVSDHHFYDLWPRKRFSPDFTENWLTPYFHYSSCVTVRGDLRNSWALVWLKVVCFLKCVVLGIYDSKWYSLTLLHKIFGSLLILLYFC